MADPKPIALWAVPRSISTAFERIFVERDDFEVLHEPFSASYYRSRDRLSGRYRDERPDPEHDYARVLSRVLRPRERRIFIKDMAYQAKPLLNAEFAASFTNTFILRDPKYVLTSLHKKWPDFTLEETGYEDLWRLYRLATEAGQNPPVVDSMTFSENPVAVLQAYCDRIGVPFDPDSLSWKPGEVRDWEAWEGWHDEAQRSSGIEPAERRDFALPPELERAYEQCLPYYYRLAAHLTPINQG